MADSTAIGTITATQTSTIADTVLKLVQAGFLGFGALLFIMAFIIIYQNKPASQDQADFRKSFLYLGVGAYVFAGLMQLIPFVMPARGANYRLSVAFSPSLSTAHLPDPSMALLPQNQPVKLMAPVSVSSDTTLQIGIDGIIDQAQQLSAANNQLKTVAQQLSQANTQLAAAAPVAAASSTVAAAVKPQADAVNKFSLQVQSNLARGDFTAAALSAKAVNAASFHTAEVMTKK